MQLCYRGIPYQKNPTTIPSIEGEIVGKYRGKPWRKLVFKGSFSVQRFRQLKYRGISYISSVWGLKPTHSTFGRDTEQWVLSNASVPSLLQRPHAAIANGATYFQTQKTD
jgi:hypothetical protein